MITEFFDDIIFRREDVLDEFRLSPNEGDDFYLSYDEDVVIFVVRTGEKL